MNKEKREKGERNTEGNRERREVTENGTREPHMTHGQGKREGKGENMHEESHQVQTELQKQEPTGNSN